jgi:FkbM family methyltransferase
MPALRHRAAHFMLRKLGMFDRSYRERIAGREFVIPIINGRKTYAMEPWMADVIRLLFSHKTGAFIDVGVNLGQTLLKVAAIDPERQYLGFEPNPTCVDYVWKLIEKNHLDYTVIPAGVGDQTTVGNLHLFRNEDTDSSASTVSNFRPTEVASRPVLLIDADSLPDGTIPAQVAVVKIDVEGGELEVMRGLRPVLERSRPFIVVEILPASNPERLARQDAIEALMKELDYSISRIARTPDQRLERLVPIDTCGVQTDLSCCDYVLAPREIVLSQ